ncbi:hypothetical protein K1719_017335 [Acacia pycnantha]|nr:hypothetical protein K1719_017335 [Acacia pycnantha]
MLFTAVYANPSEQRRHRTWETLHNMACEIAEPWLLAGDFNEIKTPAEQQGGGRVNDLRCRKFNDWIEDCKLIDIESNGPFFTWKGPKWEGLDRVYKWLDRCLCNVSWYEKFEEAEVRVLPRLCSDHHPVLVSLSMENKGWRKRTFRYEAMWKMHSQFEEVIVNSWNGEGDINTKLAGLQQDLIDWNKEVFGQIEGHNREYLLGYWKWRGYQLLGR